MAAKRIMVQGTMSNAGKSFLAAALCRIFAQDGYRTAPFKSQNMALNSYITREGLEIGRAQAMQAEAAGVEPSVHMNPILLKPTSHVGSQVIINGEVFSDMNAMEYYRRKQEFIPAVMDAFHALERSCDVIVLEGAGSPAEINLADHDIVNMGMARMADAPVLLVGDIDRGGVFASLYGTVELLKPEDRVRVKGLIINKFRGDKAILEPGLRMIEEKLGIPVLGVVPMSDIDIEEEDSLSSRLEGRGYSTADSACGIDIAVVRLPHISNFTDFQMLEQEGNVFVRYVSAAQQLGKPDLVILPGTKNTMEDLKWLRESGLEGGILRLVERHVPLIGICGGYQMLGRTLSDPDGAEGGGSIRGMGLLDVDTVFRTQKTRTRVSGILAGESRFFPGCISCEVSGYEIHMGETKISGNAASKIVLPGGRADGAEREDGLVFGSYLHGLFENRKLVTALITALAEKKGISLEISAFNWEDYKETQYDKLADVVREALDLEAIYRMMEEEDR